MQELNFLYCFDKNYNIQASVSIFSLLENISEKINIYIIHKDPKTFSEYLSRINKHPNLSSIKIDKFDIPNFSFPNIEGTHVSEATYYRFFIEKYIDPKIENLIYLDSDIVCVSDPIDIIKATIKELNNSNYFIAAKSEPQSLSKNLELKSGKYFNAGVIIIKTSEWFAKNLNINLIELAENNKEKLQFWDQDVLNLYFDGSYQELSKYLNFSLDMKPFERDNNLNLLEKENIKFIHYVGKFKPWSLKGIVNNKSEFYQYYYRELFKDSYHLSSSRKLNTLRDFTGSLNHGVFFRVKYPYKLLFKFLYSIVKVKQ